MARVWYPFSEDHPHCGKFWEGRAPSGDLAGLQKLSGFLLEAPEQSLIVSPEQVLMEELAVALADFEHYVTRLAGTPDAERHAKALKATVKMNADQCKAAVGRGNTVVGRQHLHAIEATVGKLKA